MNFIERANQQRKNPPSQPLFPRAGTNPYQQPNPPTTTNLPFSTSHSHSYTQPLPKPPSKPSTLNLDKYSIKPAPKDQFKRYIQKSQNVFYDQRYQMKLATIIKILMAVLAVFLFALGLLYLTLQMFQPYEGPPPKHGYVRNKVLYCDFGYEKRGRECVVQQGLSLEAEYFAEQLVEDLRIQYGDYDCTRTTGFPTRNIREMIENNENIELRKATILYQQANLFLQDTSNKKRLKYEYDNDRVWPTQKQHSFHCKINLLLESNTLWYCLAAFLTCSILAYYLSKWYRRRQLAWQIYLYLKNKVMAMDTVNIQQQNAAIERIGHLDERMWEQVDRFRTEERLIGFFEDDNLYWKKLS